jgi:hypothetical protein
MPVLPLIPLHIIYDSEVIDEQILLKYVAKLPEYMKTSSEEQKRIRLNLVCTGSFFSEPNLDERQADLRAAFDCVLFQYRQISLMGNSEVLIFLGTQPIGDWQSAHEEIEQEFRGLILTYWFEKGVLSGPRGANLDALLAKISRPDPNQRHKVVSYQTADDIERTLDDVFKKLAGRLDWRLSNVGKAIASTL